MAAEEVTVEQSAQLYVGEKGLPGDVWNNMFAAQMNLSRPDDWPAVKPLKSYAGYLHKSKFRGNQPLADAVVAASDPRLVAEYDKIISAINEKIADGVKTKDQADAIYILLDDMRELIYGYRKTLAS